MLDLCLSCARHVRRAEPRCPFCGSAARASVSGTSGRLGRTALFAIGATVVACGSPNCPKDDSPPRMDVVTLPDGGTELRPAPIAIYGTAPPCR